MPFSTTSPFTRLPITPQGGGGGAFTTYIDSIGDWAASDGGLRFLNNGLPRIGNVEIVPREHERVVALMASKVWEAHVRGELPPLFMKAEGVVAAREKGDMTGVGYKDHRVWTLEELLQESRGLTLEEKARRTALNIAEAEAEVGAGFGLKMNPESYPWLGGETPQDEGQPLDPTQYRGSIGLAYGCTLGEARVVFPLAIERGWISVRNNVSAGAKVFLTPEGYSMVDAMRQGDADVTRKAFLVCRFNDEMDAFVPATYHVVGLDSRVNCPISRVKDVHHVERVDDRILRMIEEATIIVVDLTDENFNLGLEAGYALALGKSIVWARKKVVPFKPLPFDIQSQNLMEWEEDKLEEFREMLVFRMLAALDAAEVSRR